MRMTDDPDRNLARAVQGIREAAGRGAALVCLPELFRTHYFCQREDAACFDLAEPIPGPTTTVLGALAAELRVTLVVSVFERRAPGLYHNTAVVLGPDGTEHGRYRKMHIPDDPLYYEKFYFAPGDLGFPAIATPVAKVAPLVCWDQWFPEAARLAALAGAAILLYPTAIAWHPSERRDAGDAQLDAWRTVQRAHAIANGVFVAAVNRVGHEGAPDAGLDFWGASFVCDPFGRVLAEAPCDAEAVLVAEIDPRLQEETRRHWPFLRDRRIDAYAELTRRLRDP